MRFPYDALQGIRIMNSSTITTCFFQIIRILSHADLTNLTKAASLKARSCRLCRVLAAGWHIRAIAMYASVRFVKSVWDKFIGLGFRVFREIRVNHKIIFRVRIIFSFQITLSQAAHYQQEIPMSLLWFHPTSPCPDQSGAWYYTARLPRAYFPP